MTRLSLLLVSLGLFGFAQKSEPSKRTERIVAAGKVWAFVKHFHPYLAYRPIDWDRAWELAAPTIAEASQPAQLQAALTKLLAPLGDPVTRVTSADFLQELADSTDPLPSFRLADDGVLIVTIRNPQDFVKAIAEMKTFPSAFEKAKSVLFDLRGSEIAEYLIKTAEIDRLLSTAPVRLPPVRQRMHSGYAPPDSSGSGGYSSAWVVSDTAPVLQAPGARDLVSVFLVDEKTAVPPIAFGLQLAGKAAIVSEGGSVEGGIDSLQPLDAGEGMRVLIRYREMILPDGSRPAANLTFPPERAISQDSAAFQAALEAARTGTWPKAPTTPASAEAALAEKLYQGEPYPSRELRQLAAIKIWATFEYFFPYKHLMERDWNRVLADFLPRLESAGDARQYHLAVAEMLTHTQDSHVVAISPLLMGEVMASPTLAMLRWIENRPVVVRMREKVEGLEPGDVVLKIDGRPVAERIEFLKKITTASTPQSLMLRIAHLLLNGPDGSEVAAEVEGRDGTIKTVKLQRSSRFYQIRPTVAEAYRLLPGNIGYVDLTEISVPQVDEMFEKLKSTRAILLDMRGYPKGTAWSIAPRLAEKTGLAAALFRRRIVMAPTGGTAQYHSLWNTHEFLQAIPPTAKWRYTGRTVMLIDERAISQSEHSGLFYETANSTKFVGSRTAGANGDVTWFPIPGGIRINFSGHDVRHADGRQLQRIGLVPDLEVHPTIAGIRAGVDEVLDRALKYVEELVKE
jgi:C-terminal processing protease CtpA/Prc